MSMVPMARTGGIADLRVLGDDAEVAERSQLRAAGQAVAVDLGDDRFRQLPEDPVAEEHVARPVVVRRVRGVRVRQLRARVNVGRPFARVAAGREVVACAEGAAGRLEDDDADVPVGLGFLQCVEELATQFVGEGVELLRAVEGDDGETVVAFVEDVLVRHRLLPFRGCGDHSRKTEGRQAAGGVCGTMRNCSGPPPTPRMAGSDGPHPAEEAL